METTDTNGNTKSRIIDVLERQKIEKKNIWYVLFYLYIN